MDRTASSPRHVVALLAAAAAAVALTGCQHIPTDASKAAFCGAGEKFSALSKVPFADGQKATDRLAAVGTPADIDSGARDGFVELIDRMNDSSSAADFRKRTASMDSSERDHLFALDTYIQGTCSDRVPSNAAKATFCATATKFANLKPAQFDAARQSVDKLAQIGTPDDADASARLGFIELIDRINSSRDATDFGDRSTSMSQAETSHLAALDTYIKQTCS